MGVQYNPDFTIPQATQGYNPLAISSSTNATPIVITTGSNHGYATGDSVVVENHATNTNANGRRTITVLASNTFSLNGSVGNGVGGATGYVIDYAVNPLIVVPSGGDTRNASSVSSPMEGIANNTPWLYERVGQYRIYNVGRIAHSDAMDAATWSSTSVPGGGAWTALTSASWAYQWSFARNINIYNTDILVVKFQALAQLAFAAVTTNGLALGAAFNGGAMTLVTGTATGWNASFTGEATLEAVLFASDFTATQSNSVTFGIMGSNSAVGANTIALLNPYHINVIHYRVNS